MSQFRLSQFSRGDVIFQEGDPGTEAFLIRSGSVVIHRTVGDEDVLLALLSPDEVFGEMALVTEGKRTATATAAEETEIVLLAKEAFLDHLTRGTPLLREVFGSMARRLEFTSRQLRKPRTKYPTLSVARIVDMIRQQVQSQGKAAVPVASAFQQIQDILDLTTDEISQVLDQMAAARLIEWRTGNGDPMMALMFNDPETFGTRLAKWIDTLPEKAVSTDAATSSATTAAPCARRAATHAAPMPDAAPVTSATSPASAGRAPCLRSLACSRSQYSTSKMSKAGSARHPSSASARRTMSTVCA